MVEEDETGVLLLVTTPCNPAKKSPVDTLSNPIPFPFPPAFAPFPRPKLDFLMMFAERVEATLSTMEGLRTCSSIALALAGPRGEKVDDLPVSGADGWLLICWWVSKGTWLGKAKDCQEGSDEQATPKIVGILPSFLSGL